MKMAVEIIVGVLLFCMCGNFGHTACPVIWHAIASPADIELRKLVILAIFHRYCDDIMGFGLTTHRLQNKLTIQNFFRRYLGDSAINPDKSFLPSSSGELIGWFLDLNKETLRPNDKGIDKLFFLFFRF